MKVLSTSLATPGLSADRLHAKLINFALHADCPVNLPKGEQPQSATRINNHKSSEADNEYCLNKPTLALPERFKGEASCLSQTVTFSLLKRD